MAKIIWDKSGERIYETGVDRGVLYVFDKDEADYGAGVPWNGLISVSENPTGAEANAQYADNIKYLNLVSAEEFEASVEAFTYPNEFAACDGSVVFKPGLTVNQQSRSKFALCYRTLVGSDTEDLDHGYKLHLVYGALASPTDKSYGTETESPEAMTFSWDITTTPVEVTGYKPTACLIIESHNADADGLAALEAILYGTDGALPANAPRIPLPDEVLTTMTPANG